MYTRPSATCGWISNAPWLLFSRLLSTQIVFPVAALSANTEVDESPYTVPSATAPPSGPGPLFSGMFTWYSHFSLPVARASAYTLASSSCRYTTPSCTTGGAVSEPIPETLAAAVPASLNAQASRRPDTFAAEIAEPGTSLALAISPFGSGHDPVGAAAPGNAVLAGAALPPPLHAAASIVIETSTVTGTNSRIPARARPASFPLIRPT